MNTFEKLNAWYQEKPDSHRYWMRYPTSSYMRTNLAHTSLRWRRGDLFSGSSNDPSQMCLVGGISYFKLGTANHTHALRFLQTRRERRVLRRAIREVTGLRSHSVIFFNDKYAGSFADVERVLDRAAELWDKKYPPEPPAQPLQVAPFALDFSEMNESPAKADVQVPAPH